MKDLLAATRESALFAAFLEQFGVIMIHQRSSKPGLQPHCKVG